jgi:hypothetical protein
LHQLPTVTIFEKSKPNLPTMKRNSILIAVFTLITIFTSTAASGKNTDLSWLKAYNIVWNSPSKNAGESMPCGGGDIGMNVWVEKGDLMIYLSRSGTFDELNGFPKLGRIRVHLTPNPLDEGTLFRQELKLEEGVVEITAEKSGLKSTMRIWADVFLPAVHIDIRSNLKTNTTFTYENWRQSERDLANSEKEVCRSWLGTKAKATLTKDQVFFTKDSGIEFYHQNRNTATGFDLCVDQQELNAVKDQLFNPLQDLIFGGKMIGANLIPDGTTQGRYASTDFTGWKLRSKKATTSHQLTICLHTAKAKNQANWEAVLDKTCQKAESTKKTAATKSIAWWKSFWDRSYIRINENQADKAAKPWQVGRNYQVFRYQLGCNAYGSYPTKFNGGLFTYDPEFVESKRNETPDFRRWGGGSFTAQNQRLVYWPMLKSGDFDLMKPQFDFYLRILRNAELRSETYWGHKGACFTEQMENFGLPVAFEYNWKRPKDYDPGVEYNNWIEHTWETVFEFCLMILDEERFTGQDITEYIPLMESSLTFFDEHYQYLSAKRTTMKLDADGHLVLYPSTAAETYKVAYNSITTVCGMRSVLTRMLELDSTRYLTSPDSRKHWAEMQQRVPPIYFREMNGHKVIAPAKSFERINNTEIPQLYPVFPYNFYGIGKPDLQVAIDTWHYGIEREDQHHYQSWHQDNIFCARLGLTDEATNLAIKKLEDSKRRFPTFWGPGNDWVPDHNWGGSGMIGLQEMLMQTDGKNILLFASWPKAWDVTFKLNAPYNTTIEATLKDGKITSLIVKPESRKKDVQVLLSEYCFKP